MFAANVDGIYHCCRAAVPYLVQQHSGTIINVSSIWGCAVPPARHYSASKAAVIGFTQALAKELAPQRYHRQLCRARGHRYRNECPPYRRRTPDAGGGDPLGRMGSPEEVAAAIAFLSGEDARYFTGQVLSPNGGIVI